ncbi:hypothetical protein Tco_0841675 [Tanacetum coccineum]|uniref:Uncharacterized protein n=1 Tax=Tanacetum coccineum TaxID=301880 RepID=A0ABQ5B0G6_9ASTR
MCYPVANLRLAQFATSVHMACVAPRSHGGDAGGDQPDDRRPRSLSYQCQGSGKRGESKHTTLKKAFKQNGNRKLEIVFEAKDQKTFKPIVNEVNKILNSEPLDPFSGETIKFPKLVVTTGPGYGTREQLEDMKRQHALEKEEKIKSSKGQQNALKKFVDFFNRHQGTPSLLYTIYYTPEVYTPTFDTETSQSGEQDDNGSDDGNREYDVDIYDDESKAKSFKLEYPPLDQGVFDNDCSCNFGFDVEPLHQHTSIHGYYEKGSLLRHNKTVKPLILEVIQHGFFVVPPRVQDAVGVVAQAVSTRLSQKSHVGKDRVTYDKFYGKEKELSNVDVRKPDLRRGPTKEDVNEHIKKEFEWELYMRRINNIRLREPHFFSNTEKNKLCEKFENLVVDEGVARMVNADPNIETINEEKRCEIESEDQQALEEAISNSLILFMSKKMIAQA